MAIDTTLAERFAVIGRDRYVAGDVLDQPLDFAKYVSQTLQIGVFDGFA